LAESGIEKSCAGAEQGLTLRLRGLAGAYSPGRPVVGGIDLDLPRGDFFALLGPSGCGKTTLLRLIGGYHPTGGGRIILDGQDVTDWPPERRDVGMVFQNYALFPHLTARQNVAFGLEMRRVPRRERLRRVEEILERVRLSVGERDRLPGRLSGGQQQRVALARALVIEPRLLLLDEPLANLDRGLREQMRGELRDLQRRTGVSTLLVTHDQEEALALADRVGVMHEGRLLQEDTPEGLYRRPACPFVARFVGEANLFWVEEVAGWTIRVRGGATLTGSVPSGVEGRWVMIRPEHCVLGSKAAGCPCSCVGRIRQRIFLGADELVTVGIAPDVELLVRLRGGERGRLSNEEVVTVGILEGALWPIPESSP
jgi:ABC-type Fe3+/spermidine/putrescine transport system ATPase subunit